MFNVSYIQKISIPASQNIKRAGRNPTERKTDMKIGDTITVYSVEKNGKFFRVAGYDRETALKVINDPTVKAIVGSDKLIAVDKNGIIVETSENMKNYKNERINTWKR